LEAASGPSFEEQVMTHEDAGKYRAKHPAGTAYDPAVAAALTARAEEGKISCTDAHAVAGESGIAPAEAGRTADLLELRIHRCQMGLFGYSPEKRNCGRSSPAPPRRKGSIASRAGRSPGLAGSRRWRSPRPASAWG
jgi:hypothetical protein